MRSHLITIVFAVILATLVPSVAIAQEKTWKPIEAVAVVQEKAKSSTEVLASRSSSLTKRSDTSDASCDPLILSSLMLGMRSDAETLLLHVTRPCDKPVADTFSFNHKPFDGLERYEGSLTRGDVTYVLLDGDMEIELSSPSFPIKYKITFEVRFVTEANRDLHTRGMKLAPEDIHTEQGSVIVEPETRCSSKRTGYSFGSRHQRAPHPIQGRFCFPLFSVPTPPTPPYYPIRALSP